MFPSARPNLHEPPPASTVAERLKRARQRRFVGRAAELELFLSALAAPEPPFSVLWIYGPGGVGKTALLAALAERAAGAGVGAVSLDLRAIEPSPPAFMAELGRARGLPGEAALAGGEPVVLLLDTFEAAVGLEDWLREQFLPALPACALVVVAGRTGPGEAWRRDPGWGELLRVASLRTLGPDDARAFLRGAGVAEEQQGWMLELSHGHPPALSLLVDVLSQRPADAGPLELGAAPDVVAQLVESFLAGLPSPRHRLALDSVAHARVTTAGLLGSVFGDRQGEELFAWLRGLSFMESGPDGLFPHDLVREVLDADLSRRDPAAYREVHRQLRQALVKRVLGREGRDRWRALADLMYLHRANPAASAVWDWKSLGAVYADGLRGDGDARAIVAMVKRYEGAESAAIAKHWLERQPAGFYVVRGHGPDLLGFAAHIALHEAGAEDFERDPGARAVWAHAQGHAPPRPGDEVLLVRFVMDREAYQAPSRSLNVVTIRNV